MIQNYKDYTAEQQWVWKELFSRQHDNLLQKGTALHNESVSLLNNVFNADSIPKLADLSTALLEHTGWQIHIVEGFIPAVEFLTLLSEKKFAASTWLRQPAQLDYLEEPDMFHDVFGHLPVLCDNDYASFVYKVGLLGKKYSFSPECVDLIERFYWYSIEFGLVKENGEIKIFGAGIISSYGETNRIFEDSSVEIKEFNLAEILYLPFDKSSLQPIYYVAGSFKELYLAVDELTFILEKTLEKEKVLVM